MEKYTGKQPMSREEFQKELTARTQEMMLNSESELSKNNAFYRERERDVFKSNLRMQEMANKQLMRQIKEIIYCENSSIIWMKMNGMQMILDSQAIFEGKIQAIKRYRRQKSIYDEWQITLKFKNGVRVESPLYDVRIINSETKLKKTILGRYIHINTNAKSRIWEWLKEFLLEKIEEQKTIEIPSKDGWFIRNDGIHFWTNQDDPNLLTKEMMLFGIKQFDKLIAKDTLEQIFEKRFQISEFENVIGMMLMIRQIALLERLAMDKVLGMKVAVVGEDAIAIAKEYLCVMNAEEADVINIDSERFSSVKERMKIFQDTPIIFVSNDLENRNHQQKMRDVIGLIDCGYLEGEKIRISGVFCLKKISKSVPIDDMIILEASKIRSLEGSELFAKFQNLIITAIEKSGMVWIEKLRKQVEYYSRNKHEKCGWGPIMNSIKNFILNLFDSDEIGYILHRRLNRLLEAGIDEIERQLTMHGSILVEKFREQIVSLVERGVIAIADRYNVSDDQNCNTIFYDSDFYYFVKDVFDVICKNSVIDEKSILFIKQRLADEEMNKMYKASSGSKRELNIDISILINGKKVFVSVYAIKKEFFDEIGGISLFERGEIYHENVM